MAEADALEASASAARSEYSTVAERNAEELVVWRAALHADMHAMLQELVTLQVST